MRRCPVEHEMTPENTATDGACRECRRERNRERRRAAARANRAEVLDPAAGVVLVMEQLLRKLAG